MPTTEKDFLMVDSSGKETKQKNTTLLGPSGNNLHQRLKTSLFLSYEKNAVTLSRDQLENWDKLMKVEPLSLDGIQKSVARRITILLHILIITCL